MDEEIALHELVTSDPHRNAMEKETSIVFEGDVSEATITSAKPTIVRSLLQHDEFELDAAEAPKDTDGHGTFRSTEPHRLREAGDIYAVTGRIPIGCLTVKSVPRSNDHQSKVVNHETIREGAFGDSQ
jgi:hypothetical protein